MSALKAALVALFCIVFTQTPSRAADDYPTKSVRIIVPFGPGGTTDIVARALAEDLKNRLGQSFVVENKPGADGIIAINELVRAGADSLPRSMQSAQRGVPRRAVSPSARDSAFR